MVTCAKKDIAKFLIYISSVILMPFGIAAIIFGILILTENTCLQPDLKDNIAGGSLLIIGGVAVLAGIILATLGAAKESLKSLRTHQVPVLIIYCCIPALFCGFCRSMRPEYARERLETAMDNYAPSNEEFWKHLQSNYECCGIDGYGDWTSKEIALPESCCHKNPSAGGQDESKVCISVWNDLKYVHENGCHKELVKAQDHFYYVTRDVTIALVVCQVIAVIAVSWMIYGVRKKTTVT